MDTSSKLEIRRKSHWVVGQMTQYLKCRKFSVWLLLAWGFPRSFTNTQFIFSQIPCSLLFYHWKGRRWILIRFFFFSICRMSDLKLKLWSFEEIKHDGKCDLWQSRWQKRKLLGDEKVKRTCLRLMGLSSNLSSNTSCAILDKSHILFNSQLLHL